MPQHRLYGLRGAEYVQRYKEIFYNEKQAILIAFAETFHSEKGFTSKHLGTMCNRFLLPVTVMDSFLSEITQGVYATGTWERLQRRGVKASDIGVVWSDD